jgi:hypothetical protein
MISRASSYISRFFHNAFLFLYFFFFGVDAAPQETNKFGEDEKDFQGFSKFYEENIAPKVLLFEQIRLENLRRFIFRSRLVAIALIVSWGCFIYMVMNFKNIDSKAGGDMFNIIAGVSFFILLWPINVLRKFGLEIKSNLFAEIFRFFSFAYHPEGSKAIASYESFGIIPNYDEGLSKTEDLVVGTYKNVSFTLEELHLKIETGSGKNRRRVTKFKGAVIMFRFNKNFAGRTIVKKDLGMIGNFGIKKFDGDLKDLEKVSLEDPEFEKMFEVYSNNQIEARYLLTTSFMERLKGLSHFFQAKKIEASFRDNFLFLTFATNLNLFEVKSIFEEINVAEESRETLREIAMIYGVIDALKLNEKTRL